MIKESSKPKLSGKLLRIVISLNFFEYDASQTIDLFHQD